MTPQPTRSPMAGGFLIAVGIIVGSVVGALRGQATIGFLAGFAIGAALAILVMLVDKARN